MVDFNHSYNNAVLWKIKIFEFKRTFCVESLRGVSVRNKIQKNNLRKNYATQSSMDRHTLDGI